MFHFGCCNKCFLCVLKEEEPNLEVNPMANNPSTYVVFQSPATFIFYKRVIVEFLESSLSQYILNLFSNLIFNNSFPTLIKGRELCERASAAAGGRNCSGPLSWSGDYFILQQSWSCTQCSQSSNWLQLSPVRFIALVFCQRCPREGVGHCCDHLIINDHQPHYR